MKTLTIITTLFMPLSFVAGFFGMNFFLPGAADVINASRLLFVVALLSLMLVPGVMFWWMRRRGWM